MTKLLELKNISKTFPGVKALQNVNLDLEAGEVLGLCGENGAGKSTLMKILTGIYTADPGGQIWLEGKQVTVGGVAHARELGLSIIHQELNMVGDLTVAQNIFIGREPRKGIRIDDKKMIEESRKIFDRMHIDIDPRAKMSSLTVGKQQMCEIAKAISHEAKLIVFDEPSAALTEKEIDDLFAIIRDLREQDLGIVYISHRMDEIYDLCDRITIMRDGRYIGTWPASELTMDGIIRRMVGREMTDRFPPKLVAPSEELVLKVEHLSSPLKSSFQDISFELRRGEILGIGGLVGAQRTEFVEALFGLRDVASGTVLKDGEPSLSHSPREAKAHGLALLTEERRATGIFGILPVLENTVIANQKHYAHLGVLNDRERVEAASESCGELNVKTPSLDTLIQNLSGGNQQKVLIARWLLTNSDVLILDEPTRGIDVGAKYEIYTIMLSQVAQGKSIIMISSEMPELMGMSDRIMVMCAGRVTGMLNRDQFDQVEIMRLATQFSK